MGVLCVGIRIGDVDPVKMLLEGKTSCLFCAYYNPDVGCDRIYKQTRGRMKIDLSDPLNKTCDAFQPAIRCEDCVHFMVQKLEEAFAGRTEKYMCTKHGLEDADIRLCPDYTPKEEKRKEFEELYKKAGFEFKVV